MLADWVGLLPVTSGSLSFLVRRCKILYIGQSIWIWSGRFRWGISTLFQFS